MRHGNRICLPVPETALTANTSARLVLSEKTRAYLSNLAMAVSKVVTTALAVILITYVGKFCD